MAQVASGLLIAASQNFAMSPEIDRASGNQNYRRKSTEKQLRSFRSMASVITTRSFSGLLKRERHCSRSSWL